MCRSRSPPGEGGTCPPPTWRPAPGRLFVQTCPTCQSVTADHLPPASLLFPVPSLTYRGGRIYLDFLKLPGPVASSCNYFLEAHIQLLAGILAYPTFRTATELYSQSLVILVCLTYFTLTATLAAQEPFGLDSNIALGSSLVFCSPHHHNTTTSLAK
jgi:hypothetical protein